MGSVRIFLDKERNAPLLLRLTRVGTLAVTALLLFTFLVPGNLISEAAAFFIPQLIAIGFIGLLFWIAMAKALHWLHLIALLGLVISSYWMVTSVRQVVQPATIASKQEGGTTFSVMSLNLLHMGFDAEALKQLIEKRQPDLITFQETASATPRLKEFLAEHYQHSILPPDKHDTDITLFSKYPIKDAKRITVPDLKEGPHIPREFLSAEVNINGTPVQIYAVHPASPRGPNRLEGRSRYLDHVRKLIQSQEKKIPIVIQGDWNTPVWSQTFQSFLTELNLKTAFTSFLPRTTRYFIHPSFEAILGSKVDHIVSSEEILIKEHFIDENVGSDHFPIFATLHILP